MYIGQLIKNSSPDPPSHERKKLRNSGYPDTTEAKEATAPQIAAHSPSDRSEITIKDAPVSGGSSNGSAGSPRAPLCVLILLCTRSPPSGVRQFTNAIAMPRVPQFLCQKSGLGATLPTAKVGAPWWKRFCRFRPSGLALHSRLTDPQHGRPLIWRVLRPRC
jgi:hypothetical protein